MAQLLVTGGAGFVLCNVVHRWLEADPAATAVVMDLSRAWDSAVVSFLQGQWHKQATLPVACDLRAHS